MIGYNIAVSVISIMLSIGGMVWGLGYATDNLKLKSFGRDEIIQSCINGAIVGSLFLFLSPGGLGTGIINGLVSSSNVTVSCTGYLSSNYAICFANNYLVGLAPVTINNNGYPSLLDSSLELLVPVSTIYAILGFISSSQVSLGVISFAFTTLLTPLLSQMNFIIEALTFAIIGIYTQSALLNVIAIVAVPLLLPIGIVLRTFYPTRRLGGTMIAIAIGLFVVFPLTYLLDAQITVNYSSSINIADLNSFQLQSQSAQNSVLSISTGTITSNSLGGILQVITGTLGGLISSFTPLLNEIVSWLAILIVEVFFFPVFSIMLTITSIRELAKVFGSEVSLGRFDIF